MFSLLDVPKISGSKTPKTLSPSIHEPEYPILTTDTQSERTHVASDSQSEPNQQHSNIARNLYGALKHNHTDDTQQVIPHVTIEHAEITSSDLHLDPSARETHPTLSPDTNTFIDPPEEHELNPKFVYLSADNEEQFNACAIKIVDDTEQETKESIIVIDDSDQVTMKASVDIDNPDEDAMQTNVDAECQELAFLPIGVQVPDASHCSLVDKSWNPFIVLGECTH